MRCGGTVKSGWWKCELGAVAATSRDAVLLMGYVLLPFFLLKKDNIAFLLIKQDTNEFNLVFSFVI